MEVETIKTLLAVAFGALISASGYLFKLRMERKRVLNKVIFHMMEIWHRLNFMARYDINEMMDKLKEKFVKAGAPESDIDKYLQEVRVQLEEQILSLGENLRKSGAKDLVEDFNGAIGLLAEINPVLAYKINGNQDFEEQISSMDEYLSDMKKMYDEGEDKTQFDNLASYMIKNHLGHMLQRIENDLYDVAKEKSILSFLDVKITISSQIKEVERKADEELEELFNKAFMEKPYTC